MSEKRLLVYSPLAIWQPPIYETQLEIIQDYIDKGYDVTILTCDASLPTCEANRDHKHSICVLCRSRAQSGIDWLPRDRVEVTDYLSVTDAQRENVERFARTPIASVAELRALELDGSDLGMAVLSSLVSLTREPLPDLGQHREAITQGLRAAALIHYSIRNHIARLSPEALLVFNGRVASLRPALRAGQASGVRTLVYEVAGAPDRYLITVDTYPHDLDTLKELFDDAFDSASETIEEKAEVADSWFRARIENRPSEGQAYAGAQEVGLLPDQLASTGLRVGMFISSEDEFVAIDGWALPSYRNQADGIRQILSSFRDREDIQFVLRVHPHLRGIDNSQTRELEQIATEFPSLALVRADSPVHTYTLIEAVDVVITFGSTVAIEAVYLGKPSIMLGRHIFEDMGGVVRPMSHSALVDILVAAAADNGCEIPASARAAVVRFGFAQSRFGIPYRFVRRTSPGTAVLVRNGEEYHLAPSLAARLATAPARALRRFARPLRRFFSERAKFSAA